MFNTYRHDWAFAEVWANIWVAKQQLVKHVHSIKTWWCGSFFCVVSHWPGVCRVEECSEEKRRRYSLTSAFQEGIVQLLPEKTGNNLSVQTHCTAVMSGLDRTVYLSPYTVDLPEQWKLRPPKSCWSSMCLCVCVCVYMCALNLILLSTQNSQGSDLSKGKPVLNFRQKGARMDEGWRSRMGETRSRWVCLLCYSSRFTALTHPVVLFRQLHEEMLMKYLQATWFSSCISTSLTKLNQSIWHNPAGTSWNKDKDSGLVPVHGTCGA